MLNLLGYCLKYLYLKRRKKSCSFNRERVKRKSRTVLENQRGRMFGNAVPWRWGTLWRDKWKRIELLAELGGFSHELFAGSSESQRG